MQKITPEIQQRIDNFKKQYSEMYPYNILKDIESLYLAGNKQDIYQQIYSAIGLIEKEKDHFYQYFSLICNNFDLNQNILEIGAGAYPRLSQIIDEHQTTGSITCYDPFLVTTKLGRIKLYKKLYDKQENFRKYDLVISTNACEATDTVLSLSLKEKKDFFLVFCPCYTEKMKKEAIEYALNNLDRTKKLMIEPFDGISNRVIFTRKR